MTTQAIALSRVHPAGITTSFERESPLNGLLAGSATGSAVIVTCSEVGHSIDKTLGLPCARLIVVQNGKRIVLAQDVCVTCDIGSSYH